MALGDQVKARCGYIPQVWPAQDSYSQLEVEQLVQRDAADTRACASTSIRYVDRIRARDRELQKAVR